MTLHVVNSDSSGNSYFLRSTAGETLLLECGVAFDRTKKALHHDLTGVAGLLLSHCHGDHAKGILGALAAGINCYSSAGTFDALGITKHHRAKAIKAGVSFRLGTFTVKAFHVEHDVPDPFGFLIHHKECGNAVFITDTHFVPASFRGLNNIIIEANYSEKIIDQKLWDGSMPGFLRKRIIESHMSLETCKEFFSETDLSKVSNIVLIHLSSANSDAKHFQKEVEIQTGCSVTVADTGMVIPLDINPF